MLHWIGRLRRFSAWRRFLGNVFEDALTLWHACRHRDTPLRVKLLALLIPAYMLSPLDLVPEVLVVLGVLDDLILAPMAVRWVLRLVPPHVLRESRQRAQRVRPCRRRS